MQFDDPFGDRKTETSTAFFSCARIVHLLKFLKNPRVFARRYAGAGVADADFEHPMR